MPLMRRSARVKALVAGLSREKADEELLRRPGRLDPGNDEYPNRIGAVIEALVRRYGVDLSGADAWRNLAILLAVEHVPALALCEDKRRGRKTTRGEHYASRVAVHLRDAGTVAEARRRVASELAEWLDAYEAVTPPIGRPAARPDENSIKHEVTRHRRMHSDLWRFSEPIDPTAEERALLRALGHFEAVDAVAGRLAAYARGGPDGQSEG